MTARPEPSKWARLDFPPQYRVGLEQLARDCRWRIRVESGATYVATEERYSHQRAQLLRLVKVADARNLRSATYGRFDRWPRQDQLGGPEMPRLVAELPEVVNPQSNVDTLVAFRLQFLTLPDAEIGPYMAQLFPVIASTAPDASLWVIEIEPAFRWRVAAVRALFSAKEAPEVMDRADEGRRLRFFSSQGLAEPWNFGLNVFTEPVLLAGSPWMAGVSGHRVGGTAVLLFGRLMTGFIPKQAVQGLDLFRTSGIVKSRAPMSIEDHAPAAYEAALSWWINRLNDLFAIALDVGRFTDESGAYQPAAHLGVLLSVARLFTSVQTILVEARGSELVRQSAFFDVIDLLDGLSFGSWHSMLTRPKVQQGLADLTAVLPPDARDYLLTRCRPAVEALGAVEDGFELHERMANGNIRLRQKDGKGWQDVPMSTAAHQYLRVARNSTHSFREMAQDPREISLLAAHNGVIPDALSDLAFFHLLRFLNAPHLPHR